MGLTPPGSALDGRGAHVPWRRRGHFRECRKGWVQDLELGRPGIWLRMDFEKPPSTQISCPVT